MTPREATIAHGFHRERCRIHSMAPPARKTTPEGVVRTIAPTEVGQDFSPENQESMSETTSPTHHHQTEASTTYAQHHIALGRSITDDANPRASSIVAPSQTIILPGVHTHLACAPIAGKPPTTIATNLAEEMSTSLCRAQIHIDYCDVVAPAPVRPRC